MVRYFVCLHIPSVSTFTLIGLDGFPPHPVAAYSFAGRSTVATISVQNIYIREVHRRRGPTEVVVNMVTDFGRRCGRKAKVAPFGAAGGV